MRHHLPLVAIEEGRVVERQRGDLDLAGADGLEELAAPRRCGRLPPVVHRHGRFGRPAEPRLVGQVACRMRGIEREVQVAPLHVAADRRVIGEAVVGVGEVNQVELPDELGRSRG